MTAWHAPDEALTRYVEGDLDAVSRASVDAHLPGCRRCQASLSEIDRSTIDCLEHDRMWANIVDDLDRPPRPLAERALSWLGMHRSTARLLVATPGLRVAWWLAIAAAGVLAVLARSASNDDPSDFLLFAPLVPVVCLALVFRHGLEPVGELGEAAPTSGSQVLLMRVASVLVVSVIALGVSALAIPGLAPIDAAWLLPSMAIATVALALSTFVTASRALAYAGAIWMGFVTVIVRSVQTGRIEAVTDAFGARSQFSWALVLLVAGAVLAVRQGVFDEAANR